jgi:hypothetical protein
MSSIVFTTFFSASSDATRTSASHGAQQEVEDIPSNWGSSSSGQCVVA